MLPANYSGAPSVAALQQHLDSSPLHSGDRRLSARAAQAQAQSRRAGGAVTTTRGLWPLPRPRERLLWAVVWAIPGAQDIHRALHSGAKERAVYEGGYRFLR